MAQVTLRDLNSNEEIVVPPEGYMFGRVGGDADIQLEDNSISRRQARVSFKGGQWLLETLAVPQGQRAPRPTALQPGSTFAIGQSEFEVVELDDQGDEELDNDPAAKTIAPQKGKPAPAPVPAAKKAAPASPNAKTAAAAPQQKRAPTQNAAAASAPEEEAPAAGIKGLFVGVPKGIAYYLVNVPKLLVNPVGTVRTTIEELPAEPLGKTDLIGYALPSLFIASALGSIAGGLALLIGPTHTFSLMSFIPIGALIGAVIGAVVTGFVFHPVFDWIITKLKGKSDARSRSNYFLQMQTVAIIVAVPGAVGTILSSLPIPFISLLGPLLSVVGTLVSLYVVYQWFVKFDVVKWVFMVIKVLAVLALLGTGFGFITGTINQIRAFTSGSSTVAAADVPSGDGDEAPAGEVELGEMPTDPAEAAEWSKKKQAQILAKAQEQQKKAMAQAQAAQDAANQKADDAKEAVADAKKPPAPKEEPKADPKAEPTPEPVAAKETPPAPKEEAVVMAPTGSGSYAAYARKRDAIEKAIENDPTVLSRNTELQKLYGSYTEDAYEISQKWQKDTSKKPERAKLHAHLRDAELFNKTAKTIEQIAAKLGVK
ncbi:MAG TPA: FHA domain-containing protein [Archangium sp.]